MGKLLGTILAAEITTGDGTNTFSIADTNLCQGGQHTAKTLIERDAITVERRHEGMSCWVSGTTNALYRLVSGTNNSNWQLEVTTTGTTQVTVDLIARNLAELAITWIGTINAELAGGIVDPGARAGVAQVMGIASEGTNGANFAIFLASQGTNGVNQVYPIATTGTILGNLAIQWIGTLNSIISGGTIGGIDASARAGVAQVMGIASEGTNGANFAIFLASQGTNGVNQVYPIATTGTTLANLAIQWIGTLNSTGGGVTMGKLQAVTNGLVLYTQQQSG